MRSMPTNFAFFKKPLIMTLIAMTYILNGQCTFSELNFVIGQDYGHHTLNPSNQCQWCDLNDATARANSAWSNRPGVSCDDQDTCTKQDKCNAGRCVYY